MGGGFHPPIDPLNKGGGLGGTVGSSALFPLFVATNR